ncbi:hypothetical protein ACFL08_01305 [Patescibacteria group bacterium]
MNLQKKIEENPPIRSYLLMLVGFVALVWIFQQNPEREMAIKTVDFIQKNGETFAIIKLKNDFKYGNENISEVIVSPSGTQRCKFLIEINKFPKKNTLYVLCLPRKVKISKEEFGFVLRTSPKIKTIKRPLIPEDTPDIGGC